LFIGIHHQKFSVPQAAPSKIAAVKPAAAASAATPRTQRDSRSRVLRFSHVTRAWYGGSIPRLKGYKATFTALNDSLNELLAQLLELAARWSPNYSSVSASSPLEHFFFCI
jgi:hypothetical protein